MEETCCFRILCSLCRFRDFLQNSLDSNQFQLGSFDLKEENTKKILRVTEEITNWVESVPPEDQNRKLDRLLKSPIEAERVGLSKEAMAILTLTNYMGDSE